LWEKILSVFVPIPFRPNPSLVLCGELSCSHLLFVFQNGYYNWKSLYRFNLVATLGWIYTSISSLLTHTDHYGTTLLEGTTVWIRWSTLAVITSPEAFMKMSVSDPISSTSGSSQQTHLVTRWQGLHHPCNKKNVSVFVPNPFCPNPTWVPLWRAVLFTFLFLSSEWLLLGAY
jgi:hypothetical protein